ncbi:uncharacterized protein AMSG_03116 [Thecamonas trahens ATCC 50062]|uniref:Uncharacterized protein n=1 Tax=Thecamonas trahens ATCC 50062 TaxID=461836 RepID=A0A0L0D5U4_THETB|nr:hypothetical protein AMSG_03116 [Thecamonas trahens ATCC 50062]KNC46678.1 hypothetical protein AMSG_03116 [Thecamonas trahens ATCC 50062]|eukprot:XP_013760448.1 hypothetical protein AMSG_03116 [Thecamonas trahens ATCC 50062]
MGILTHTRVLFAQAGVLGLFAAVALVAPLVVLDAAVPAATGKAQALRTGVASDVVMLLGGAGGLAAAALSAALARHVRYDVVTRGEVSAVCAAAWLATAVVAMLFTASGRWHLSAMMLLLTISTLMSALFSMLAVNDLSTVARFNSRSYPD